MKVDYAMPQKLDWLNPKADEKGTTLADFFCMVAVTLWFLTMASQ